MENIANSEPREIGGIPILSKEELQVREAREQQRAKLMTLVPDLTDEEVTDLLLKWGDRVRDLQAVLYEIVRVASSPAHRIVAINGLDFVKGLAMDGLKGLHSKPTQSNSFITPR